MRKFECCGNCKYWKTVLDCDWGICHKNASRDDSYQCTDFDGLCVEFCHTVRISSSM